MGDKPSNPRASENCETEMNGQVLVALYISHAWTGIDHVANNLNHAKRVVFYSAGVKQENQLFDHWSVE